MEYKIMKKLLFILATVSLLTLASCSSKESKCEKAIENSMKIAGALGGSDMGKLMKASGAFGKAALKDAVKKCVENYDAAAVSCLADADSILDLAKCKK